LEIGRRTFLQCLTAATVTIASGLAGPQGASVMYGLIAKLTTVPGKRDELIAILEKGTRDMPGCLSYILAKDAADENMIWVTEIWDSAASHEASLSLASVKDSIVKGKPLITGFERVAVTNPVAGIGFPTVSKPVPQH
jgi:quinol monooxygenase YgiN